MKLPCLHFFQILAWMYNRSWVILVSISATHVNSVAFPGRRLVFVGTRMFNRLRTVLGRYVDYIPPTTLLDTDSSIYCTQSASVVFWIGNWQRTFRRLQLVPLRIRETVQGPHGEIWWIVSNALPGGIECRNWFQILCTHRIAYIVYSAKRRSSSRD